MTKEPVSQYIIRFNDCDPFSHLNNASYINYFMNAREDHLVDAYGIQLKDYAVKGLGWVVTEHQIAYLKPALVAEKVQIFSRVLDFSSSYIRVEMWMTDDEKKKVKSVLWSTFTHIDLKTGRRAEHDPQMMELLEQIATARDSGETFDQRIAAMRQQPV
ncbi:acyl-CoA thioesterase [Chitinophaga lutea]|uniref:Acyl-CoA thioesterase n=1 Tax=Chitinophaga lutea TaxID=2488634 RepID=A0A3N4PV62_9BACT|nr:acyl-CoA thioesterase [Chitinophaga lutea]RPE08971.1 acyl-CoA thioesterase [Chitinophaga lutea]